MRRKFRDKTLILNQNRNKKLHLTFHLTVSHETANFYKLNKINILKGETKDFS